MTLRQIIDVLRASEVPQVIIHLVKFDANDKVIGKCALGVLACESGRPELKLDSRNQTIDHSDILEAYGCDHEKYDLFRYSILDEKFDTDSSIIPLTEIIWRLNDVERLTFKEIADFLETTFAVDLEGQE